MRRRDKIGAVVRSARPRFVDTGNPALAVDCPRCGLLTPRFLPYCRNCSFALWPSRAVAGAAFHAWQHGDPARAAARPFDMELPQLEEPPAVDYEALAHRLGIHLFPSSSWPFVICVGFLFLGLAAVPFPGPARLTLFVVGLPVFLLGVVGWVVVEDVRMYEDVVSHEDGGHDGAEAGHQVAGHPADDQGGR
jgi:hypothetical protein